MAKAHRIFKRRFNLKCRSGLELVVEMDLFKLAEGHPKSFPEGYRFSWIAFDPDRPNERVLFDCHDPKGPHVHVDSDPDGDQISWTTLDEIFGLFFERVRERFGEYEELQ